MFNQPAKLLGGLGFPRDAPLPLDEAGRELHQDGFDGVRTGPAPGRQQLHTDGPALHHEALLNSRFDDTHKGWREGKVVRKHQVQQDKRDAQLDQIFRQRRVRIEPVKARVPLVQVVVDEFDLK